MAEKDSYKQLIDRHLDLDHRMKQGMAGLKWNQEQADRERQKHDIQLGSLRERVAKLEGQTEFIREDQQTGQHNLIDAHKEASKMKGKDEARKEVEKTGLEKAKVWAPVIIAVVGGIAGIVTAIVNLLAGGY
ncbi:MAG: hypothetical protein ACPGVG_08610 [Mycobacterium sp.]